MVANSETPERTGPTLTDEARRELTDELAALRGQREDLIDTGGEARAEDVGDHAESLRRADDASRIDDRISEIVRLLEGGAPGAGDARRDDPALPEGARATLRYDDGTEETVRVVSTTDAVGEDERDAVLTLDSPLGQALLERGAEDTVTYDGPDGERTATLLDLTAPR